jgi:hypothetical protein
MDHITWVHVTGTQYYSGIMELNRLKGTLIVQGKMHNLTPFPQWVSAKIPYLVPVNKNH